MNGVFKKDNDFVLFISCVAFLIFVAMPWGYGVKWLFINHVTLIIK
jgi:hypothetical protein